MPEIDFSKTYDLVRIGKYSDYRMRTLKTRNRTYTKYGDSHMDNDEITGSWTDEAVFILLRSKLKFETTGFDGEFMNKLDYARKNLVSDRQPWPHRDSVFIIDDTIYIYFK